MFTKVKDFFKKETVCCIAFLLAVVSMFFIPPSVNYFSYIDFRVLALLFSLMAVVRGFSSIGVFTRLGTLLLHKVHSLRTLAALFVFLCFFFSMLITNDVALITFVPFTILVLSMADQRQALIPVIVLETIAANLGSMLTPLGNPQNLYLYTISGLSLWDLSGSCCPIPLYPPCCSSFSCWFFQKSLSRQAIFLQSKRNLPPVPLISQPLPAVTGIPGFCLPLIAFFF